MKKRYRIWVDLDVEAGTTAKGIVELEGVEYQLSATPVNRSLEELRRLLEEGDSTFGGEPSMSLGPRGEVCPTCGR